jgi:hypothetical protein
MLFYEIIVIKRKYIQTFLRGNYYYYYYYYYLF